MWGGHCCRRLSRPVHRRRSPRLRSRRPTLRTGSIPVRRDLPRRSRGRTPASAIRRPCSPPMGRRRIGRPTRYDPVPFSTSGRTSGVIEVGFTDASGSGVALMPAGGTARRRSFRTGDVRATPPAATTRRTAPRHPPPPGGPPLRDAGPAQRWLRSGPPAGTGIDAPIRCPTAGPRGYKAGSSATHQLSGSVRERPQSHPPLSPGARRRQARPARVDRRPTVPAHEMLTAAAARPRTREADRRQAESDAPPANADPRAEQVRNLTSPLRALGLSRRPVHRFRGQSLGVLPRCGGWTARAA